MLALIIRFWKSALIVIVLVAAWLSFLNTDMLTAPGLARYFEALYFSITLFILGALDIGLPHGGPLAVVIILWICYFLAPLLSMSLVYEIIQEKFFSRLLPVLKGHTVICGLGRNGKLIYHLVREYSAPGHKIVLIEKDGTNPFLEALSKDHGTWVIKNDFTKLPALQKARIQTASRVFITTNLDLSNLKALVEIMDIEPKATNFRLYCHLGDLSLHSNFSATLFKEPRFADVILFNGYKCVTRRMYSDWIVTKNYLKPEGNIFVILGFGRFGYMLYTHLIADSNRTERDEIFIDTIRPKAGFELEKLQYSWSQARPQGACHIHTPMYLDMNSPVLWDKLSQLNGDGTKQMFIFACSDDDIQNLNLAISMKLSGPSALRKAMIFCRMYSHTAKEINQILEKRLTKSQAKDVILFPLQEELEAAFRRELFENVTSDTDYFETSSGEVK